MVKRFNAKIAREAKKTGNILPMKMSTKEARKNIETAADLHDLEKIVNAAMKKGAFKERKNVHGVRYTSFQTTQRRVYTSKINRQRKAALKKLQPIKGISPGNKIVSTEYQELKPKKVRMIKSFHSQRDYEEHLKSAQAQAQQGYIEKRLENYRMQYINVFNKYIAGGLELEEIDKFYEMIGKLSADEFYPFSKIHPEMVIEFLYPSASMTERTKYQMIIRSLNSALADMGRMDIEDYDMPIDDIFEPPEY